MHPFQLIGDRESFTSRPGGNSLRNLSQQCTTLYQPVLDVKDSLACARVRLLIGLLKVKNINVNRATRRRCSKEPSWVYTLKLKPDFFFFFFFSAFILLYFILFFFTILAVGCCNRHRSRRLLFPPLLLNVLTTGRGNGHKAKQLGFRSSNRKYACMYRIYIPG